MQQSTAELEELELQVAAVHPKVAMKAQKLQDVAQLAMLEQWGSGGWSRQDEYAESQRVRTIKLGEPEMQLYVFRIQAA